MRSVPMLAFFALSAFPALALAPASTGVVPGSKPFPDLAP